MVLSKQSIEKYLFERKLKIAPFDPESLLDCSYRLHLDSLAVYPDTGETKTISQDFHLLPNEFILVNTQEYIEVPNNLIGHISGRSRAVRLGLLIDFGAELIQPGTVGKQCLELKNLSTKPILLQPGLSVAQIYFELLDFPTPGVGNPHQNDTKPNLSNLCEEIKI